MNLTPRQFQIAHAVADGKINKEIADELGISASTVKTHISSIFKQNGIKCRAELASMYTREGQDI